MERRVCDIAIVGSGFAGSLIADTLGSSGLDLLIVEAGTTFQDEKFVRGNLLEAFANSDHDEVLAPYSLQLSPKDGFHNASDYAQRGGDVYSGRYLGIVGGTGLAWLGTCLRMCPADFRMNSIYCRGRDWPISYSDLEKWYCAAERALGVSGETDVDVGLGAYRKEPYPMPPITPSYIDRYFARRMETLKFDDTPIVISPTPQARNSIDGYNGRPQCEGYASCVPLCPVGAKYDPLVHLRSALLKGVEIWPETIALHLNATEDGKIESMVVRQSGSPTVEIAARIFIIAANAVETVRLLLRSNQRFETGLANQSGQVGRNLMDHLGKHSCALARDRVFPYRGPQSTSGIESFRDGAFRKDRAAFRTAIRNDGWRIINHAPFGSPADDVTNLSGTVRGLVENGIFGRELRSELEDSGTRQIALQSVVEMLPSEVNRVTLSRSKTDRHGLAEPEFALSVDDYTRAGFAKAAELHRRIFEVLECDPADTILHLKDNPHEFDAAGSHIMGTAVMGTDPSNSVVDADGRAHHHSNLYIVGGATFPTGGTSNSTLTISALALRMAATIRETLQLM